MILTYLLTLCLIKTIHSINDPTNSINIPTKPPLSPLSKVYTGYIQVLDILERELRTDIDPAFNWEKLKITAWRAQDIPHVPRTIPEFRDWVALENRLDEIMTAFIKYHNDGNHEQQVLHSIDRLERDGEVSHLEAEDERREIKFFSKRIAVHKDFNLLDGPNCAQIFQDIKRLQRYEIWWDQVISGDSENMMEMTANLSGSGQETLMYPWLYTILLMFTREVHDLIAEASGKVLRWFHPFYVEQRVDLYQRILKKIMRQRDNRQNGQISDLVKLFVLIRPILASVLDTDTLFLWIYDDLSPLDEDTKDKLMDYHETFVSMQGLVVNFYLNIAQILASRGFYRNFAQAKATLIKYIPVESDPRTRRLRLTAELKQQIRSRQSHREMREAFGTVPLLVPPRTMQRSDHDIEDSNKPVSPWS